MDEDQRRGHLYDAALEGLRQGRGAAPKGAFPGGFAYSAKDIRFTTKDGTLYAIVLGWPEDGKIRIRSLAKPAEGVNAIAGVALLGATGELKYTQDAEGLEVALPPQRPCACACTLKITGSNLTPATIVPDRLKPDAKGT